MAKTITFLKGNLCIFKCFIDVLQIFLFGAKEKYKMCPDLRWIFFVEFSVDMCSADFTCGETDPRSR